MERKTGFRGGRGGNRIRWIALLVVAAALLVSIPVARELLDARGLERCREPAEGPEASAHLRSYFASHRLALSRGAVDLGTADLRTLEGNLRLLRRLLEDDSLLESKIHRRAEPRKGEEPVFSAREWLCGDAGGALGGRLVRLLRHPTAAVEDGALRTLALIGSKLPAALASEPLPLFRREHLRALFGLLAGAPAPGAVAVRPFLREALRAPGDLRVWARGEPPGPRAASDLLLRALLALDGPLEDDLIEALLESPAEPEADRRLLVRALGRSGHPRAVARLLEAAAGDGSAGVRAAALLSLRESAPVETVHELRSIALRSSDGGLGALVRSAIEHIAGEPIDPGGALPLPGRLAAIRPGPRGAGEEARLSSALAFHALHPEAAGRSAEVRRRLLLLLGSPDGWVRMEAARTVGRLGLAEAVGKPPEGPRGQLPGPDGTSPALLDLLEDPEFAVASAAARALFAITAFWPPGARGEAEDAIAGSLSPELAASPARLGAFREAWEAWWARRHRSPRREWLIEAALGGPPARALAGARGLESLALQDALPAGWYRTHRGDLLGAFPALWPEARAALLSVLLVLEEPAGASGVLKLFDLAYRSDPAEGWGALRAIHRLWTKAGRPGEETAPPVRGFVEALAERPGASAAAIARYLDLCFEADSVDGELLAAIRRLSPQGGSRTPEDAALSAARRANLARWFPRAPARDKLEAAAGLLADPDPLVRFWALSRLRDLAGTDLGYDPRHPAGADQLARWREWAERWTGPASPVQNVPHPAPGAAGRPGGKGVE